MRIALLDVLRCPAAHQESWLVGSFDAVDGGHALTGTLGCPVCKAEYPIRDGVLWMGGTDAIERAAAAPSSPLPAATEQEAVRLAAFLELTDGVGFAVLSGESGVQASLMTWLAPTPLLLVDPPFGMDPPAGVSVIRTAGGVPLADGSARAVALDGREDDARREALARLLRTRGRITAPASSPVPDGVREISRDDHAWVGERIAAASQVIPLASRRR